MTPLFVDDVELAELLLKRGSRGKLWPAVLAILEKRGMPPVDPVLELRYFPAVKQFLDNYYGVGSASVPCSDSPENGWAAKKPKKIRNVV